MSVQQPSNRPATREVAAPREPMSRAVVRAAVPAAPAPVLAPRSLEDAEQRYLTARDAWIVAMRRANSGRPADLATLAITQEAYELATADVERWRSGVKVAVPIDGGTKRAGLEALISQEMAWRRLHATPEPKRGRLSRILRRLTGRG